MENNDILSNLIHSLYRIILSLKCRPLAGFLIYLLN